MCVYFFYFSSLKKDSRIWIWNWYNITLKTWYLLRSTGIAYHFFMLVPIYMVIPFNASVPIYMMIYFYASVPISMVIYF